MTRTYTGFTTHSVIYYGFHIAIGGPWQLSDTFSVQIDDQTENKFSVVGPLITSTTCGSVGSLYTSIAGKAFHTSSSVTLQIKWSVKSSINSGLFFGIKDISMSFGTRKSSDMQGAMITSGPSNIITPSTMCEASKYYDSSSGKL